MASFTDEEDPFSEMKLDDKEQTPFVTQKGIGAQTVIRRTHISSGINLADGSHQTFERDHKFEKDYYKSNTKKDNGKQHKPIDRNISHRLANNYWLTSCNGLRGRGAYQ